LRSGYSPGQGTGREPDRPGRAAEPVHEECAGRLVRAGDRAKRKRRLDWIDQIVLSLSARGLTTREISAHFEEVYGAKVSKDTISRITEKVAGELAEMVGPALGSDLSGALR
jgi:Transposase, Mutator family